MRSSHSLDRVETAFDDDRLVPDAGLVLPATLAHHLGLKALVDGRLDLGARVGRANAGDKVLTLWGRVRQLDAVSRDLMARAWAAGAGPGDGPLTDDNARQRPCKRHASGRQSWYSVGYRLTPAPRTVRLPGVGVKVARFLARPQPMIQS